MDGTGDGKVCLEMLGGGGTAPRVVGAPNGFVSANPSLCVNGSQLSTTCGAACRLKPVRAGPGAVKRPRCFP